MLSESSAFAKDRTRRLLFEKFRARVRDFNVLAEIPQVDPAARTQDPSGRGMSAALDDKRPLTDYSFREDGESAGRFPGDPGWNGKQRRKSETLDGGRHRHSRNGTRRGRHGGFPAGSARATGGRELRSPIPDSGVEQPGPETVVVAADEKTVALGRWPFSQRYFATAIDRLADGAKVIAFDIIFPQAELALSEEVRTRLTAIADPAAGFPRDPEPPGGAGCPDPATAMARSMEAAGNVVLAFTLDEGDAEVRGGPAHTSWRTGATAASSRDRTIKAPWSGRRRSNPAAGGSARRGCAGRRLRQPREGQGRGAALGILRASSTRRPIRRFRRRPQQPISASRRSTSNFASAPIWRQAASRSGAQRADRRRCEGAG